MEWMIYGANGFTGRLTAREAVRRGLRPVLAGRNEGSIKPLADELGLEYRLFDLTDPATIRKHISGLKLVLHCAGPFSRTSSPMVFACLAESVHYLDITGEISVFEAVHQKNAEARRADVVLLPGAGFDVVPTDCLAARLAEALPSATALQLAFEAGGGPSPGTARTSVERLGEGGCIRRDGKLTAVPMAWRRRTIPFAHAEREAVTIPWGDVYTAFVSTGIPDIEVYLALPPATIKKMQRLRLLQPLLRLGGVKTLLRKQIERRVSGPSEQRRAETGCQVWGEVSSADGRVVTATMTTPNGYDLTVSASLGLVEYLLENAVEGGYYTPSLLMGSAYAESLPGVSFNLRS
ncbi:MAG: saccharopine dehydrogenase NADP-binding domain-containing protein [Xanthomonadales bacterium]|jgi:short subunit dehydrogenase-like uncharacterized protein|nr:saccharopine dehydrogenase NADP-binding domain-containing protein [Xanthomonadales bacterium]